MQSPGTFIAMPSRMGLRALSGVGVLGVLVLLATDAEAAPKKKKPKKPAATPSGQIAPTTSAAAPAPPSAPAPQPATGEEEFSREAAVATITAVDLGKCRATNAEKGEGHVMITFASSGAPAKVVIDKGPWVGTPVAKCMASQFKKQVKVPAFKGDNVTVGKTFKFD